MINVDKLVCSLLESELISDDVKKALCVALRSQGLDYQEFSIVEYDDGTIPQKKFRIGDKIRDKWEGFVDEIIDITDKMYICKNCCFPIKLQNEWDLAK